MKLNNKGFAISSIMYIILIMCIILITVTLSILSSRNLILDKQKKNALSDIYMYSKSFEKDNWKTIVANVKAGNLSNYHVGDTKEVDLGELGKHTLRIANTTTPDECNVEGFSQTACGFVIEFADVITNHVMNSINTNIGGWRDSEMRTYVNDTIYNSLPIEIKNNIIDTYVVSGHEYSADENYITIDKLYLLLPKEIWGSSKPTDGVLGDTVDLETRQLDYYKNAIITSDNISSAAKKLNGEQNRWYLRSAYSGSNSNFYATNPNGFWCNPVSNDENGISPAFRIG